MRARSAAFASVAAVCGIAMLVHESSQQDRIRLLTHRLQAVDARLSQLELKIAQLDPAVSALPSDPMIDRSATREVDPTRQSSLESRVDELENLIRHVEGAATEQMDVTLAPGAWIDKNVSAVDRIAREVNSTRQAFAPAVFMLTTRQLYEQLGHPDHREWDGDVSEVCDWHYRTGIDGSCLVVRFIWNMAQSVDSVKCNLADHPHWEMPERRR